MIAKARAPVHLIESGVAWHDKAVGLVQKTKSRAEVCSIIEAELDPHTLIQGKVLVRGIPGERLLGVSGHSRLDAVERFDL